MFASSAQPECRAEVNDGMPAYPDTDATSNLDNPTQADMDETPKLADVDASQHSNSVEKASRTDLLHDLDVLFAHRLTDALDDLEERLVRRLQGPRNLPAPNRHFSDSEKQAKSEDPNSESSHDALADMVIQTDVHANSSQTSHFSDMFSYLFNQVDIQAKRHAEDIARDKVQRSESQVQYSDEEPPSRLKRMVSSSFFELFFCGIILANAVTVGLEVEYQSIGRAGNQAFAVTRILFSLAYIAELVLRFAAFGCVAICRSEMRWWYRFDLLLVIFSLPEIYFDILTVAIESEVTHSTGSLRVLRIIKVSRLARTFRVPRLIRFIAQLQILVASIQHSVRALFWALFLLLMIMYISSVILMQTIQLEAAERDSHQLDPMLKKHFSNIGDACMVLFQSVSGGISWYEVYEPLHAQSRLLSCVFVGYLTFTYFCVLNVVTGVFCSTAIESASRDPDVLAKQLTKDKGQFLKYATQFFKAVDKGSTGFMTLTELEEVLVEDSRLTALLELMQIDVSDVWTFFKLLDQDGSYTIELDEFLEGCCRLRGTVKNMDINEILKLVKGQSDALERIRSDIKVLTTRR